MRVDTSHAGSHSDLSSGDWVLPHEMNRKLSSIYDCFIVDISAGQIWGWWYTGIFQLDSNIACRDQHTSHCPDDSICRLNSCPQFQRLQVEHQRDPIFRRHLGTSELGNHSLLHLFPRNAHLGRGMLPELLLDLVGYQRRLRASLWIRNEWLEPLPYRTATIRYVHRGKFR